MKNLHLLKESNTVFYNVIEELEDLNTTTLQLFIYEEFDYEDLEFLRHLKNITEKLNILIDKKIDYIHEEIINKDL